MPTNSPANMAPILAVLAVASFTAVLGLRAGNYSYAPAERSENGAAVEPVAKAEASAAPTPARRAVEPDADRVELARRDFVIPVVGVEAKSLRDNFDEKRGRRTHEAIDIMAPRGTPVVAVADGKVAKLFKSIAGGISLYQFDRDERYVYYYAHLEGYAGGIVEGKVLKQGEVLGYVGTTGNAPPGAPHLHFTIFKMGPEKQWWRGKAVNPYALLAGK